MRRLCYLKIIIKIKKRKKRENYGAEQQRQDKLVEPKPILLVHGANSETATFELLSNPKTQ